MPGPIDNNKPVDFGYYSHPDDATQVKTAQRGTFKPSLSNKITNFFGKSDKPGLQKIGRFVNSMRDKDLSLRQSITQNRTDAARKRIAMQAESADASGPALADSGQQQRLTALELKSGRLTIKKDLGLAATKGSLADAALRANDAHQRALRSQGYVPVKDLAQQELPQLRSNYLTNPDGLKIKLHSDRPPLLARTVAGAVSRQYDEGVTGVDRALRSAIQHGAVGVHNAALWARQQMHQQAAKSKSADENTRAEASNNAMRAAEKRGLNRAALQGNVALRGRFEQTLDKQIGWAGQLVASDSPAGVNLRKPQGKVAPPGTDAIARRLDQYFSEGAEQHPKRQAMGKFFVRLANIAPSLSQGYHATARATVQWKMRSETNADKREKNQQRLAHHGAGEFNAIYARTTRDSALHGRLQQALRDPKMQQEFEQRYPATTFFNAHQEAAYLDGQVQEQEHLDVPPAQQQRAHDRAAMQAEEEDDLYEASIPDNRIRQAHVENDLSAGGNLPLSRSDSVSSIGSAVSISSVSSLGSAGGDVDDGLHSTALSPPPVPPRPPRSPGEQ